MSLVLDASATIARLYVAECTPSIISTFEQIAELGASVPSLWKLAVANVLNIGIRRGRNTAAFRDAALANLDALPLEVDLYTDVHAWHSTLHLADRHNLTLYDAAYLELALRRGLPLASLDTHLRAAAAIHGITLLGL